MSDLSEAMRSLALVARNSEAGERPLSAMGVVGAWECEGVADGAKETAEATQ